MSLSTTQYGYIVDPMVPFTDDKGKTIKNGFIRVFMAGTSTPVITYRNYDGATNQEKIELDNSGRVMHNVIGSKGSLYKVVVYNILHSQENPLLTVDKIAVLGASINASGATIVTGLDSVTVQDENFLKATVEGTGVELALDPTEVTSEVSTTASAVTAAPDYVVPLLDKTGEGDSKKISLANLFKFALDWISRLATTITSFASGDFIAVSNTTDGARKMSKDTLLELTAQNALAGNVAPEFDPTRTSENPYKAGESVTHEDKTYTFKVDHYGAWSSAHVDAVPISNKVDMSFLIGKNILCLGDSLTAIADTQHHQYAYFLKKKTLANVIPVGIGGSCIAPPYESTSIIEDYDHASANLALLNLVKAKLENDFESVDAAVDWIIENRGVSWVYEINQLKSLNLATLDYVVVWGGTNDFTKVAQFGEVGSTDETTTIGALGKIIDLLLTANGKIKVIVVTPTVRWFGNRTSAAEFSDAYKVNGRTTPELVELIKMECEYKHIPCCDMYNDIGWNMTNFFTYFNDNDGTHPYKGLEYVADKIAAFICNRVTSLASKFMIDKLNEGISANASGVDSVRELAETASFIKIFHEKDFVARTYVTDNGTIAEHVSRAATPLFTPVNPGDILKMEPNGTNLISFRFSFYASDFSFVSNSSVSAAVVNGAAADVTVPNGVRYVRVTGYYGSPITSASVFNDSVCLVRLTMLRHCGYALHSFKGKFEKTPLDMILTSDFLEQGYYTSTTVDNVETVTGVAGHDARVRSLSPMTIHKGDEIYSDIDVLFTAIICNSSNVVLQKKSYSTSVVSQNDGIVYLYARNTSASNITPANISGKIKIKRATYEPVLVSNASYLQNGYWKADMTIGDHDARLINCRDVICNKGDLIFVNTPDLQMNVRELSMDGTVLVPATGYYVSTYLPPGNGAKASHYVVKNDGVRVLLQFAPLVSGNPPISPTDYGDCFRIVRSSALPFKAQARKWITPKASKKGRVIPCEEVMMQDGCMVGDKLWMSIDDYQGTNRVKVINLATGAVERTISHDFGHNGISDYWAGNDTGLVANGLDIYLIPNLSEVTTTMAKADAIKLTLSDGHTGSGPVCFGEDMQTMYIAVAYNLADGIDYNKVYKYRLGMENGEYDGAATLLKTYDIVYHDDEDVYFGPQNTKYAQSVKYDGYLYFAVGTSGHNFLVLDVNDETLEAVAVGRYEYVVRDANGDRVWLEPELLALNGGSIICGSRSTASSVVSLVELTR